MSDKMDSLDLFLMIIWSNARHLRSRIINDLTDSFFVLDAFDLCWSQKFFSNNMSRFYGEKLPPGSHKEKHVGTGPFTVILFTDGRPNYTFRESHRGKIWVNANVYDRKVIYREIAGGGHMIHATNTQQETAHDLALLLGRDIQEFIQARLCDGVYRDFDRELSKDLKGARSWASLGHLFFTLNRTSDYVVLRNFEDLPSQLPGHDDIDLLARDLGDLVWISNGTPVFPNEPFRVHYHVPIGAGNVPFDFRTVSDGYMPSAFSEEILASRIFDKRGFYRPSNEMYFYSLLYHALVHKPDIAEDYKSKLVRVGREAGILDFDLSVFKSRERVRNVLDSFMLSRGYKYSLPEPSVHVHSDYAACVGRIDLTVKK